MARLGAHYCYGWNCENNPEKCFELAKKSSEMDSSWRNNLLGICYQDGICVEEDYEEAINWFSKASENGNSRSLYKLGKLYYQGKGCRQDKEKAEELFTKYGTLDDDLCDDNMYDIACFYSEHADFEKAFKWFKRDFEEIGQASSAFELAKLYNQGKGCKQDKEKAKILFDQVFDSSWFQENNYMAQEALDRYDFSDSNEDLEEDL